MTAWTCFCGSTFDNGTGHYCPSNGGNWLSKAGPAAERIRGEVVAIGEELADWKQRAEKAEAELEAVKAAHKVDVVERLRAVTPERSLLLEQATSASAEQLKSQWDEIVELRKELDEARESHTRMHRRAQRLEGIEATLAKRHLDLDHIRETLQKQYDIRTRRMKRICSEWQERSVAFRKHLEERGVPCHFQTQEEGIRFHRKGRQIVFAERLAVQRDKARAENAKLLAVVAALPKCHCEKPATHTEVAQSDGTVCWMRCDEHLSLCHRHHELQYAEALRALENP